MTNRNRQRQRQGPRRANLWLPFEISGQEVTSNGTVSLLTLLANYLTGHGAEVPIGTTLGPIRGSLHVHAEAAGLFPVFMAAIYLAPEGGLTSPPTLDTEQVDAMWYTTHTLNGMVSETAAGVFGSVATSLPIQTKAMRRITEIGQALVFQIDEVAGQGDVLFDIHGHIFMKLP